MTPYGVLGGSFDPVHNGHLAIADAAKEHCNLSKIILIPAGNPPHKATSVKAEAHHRLAMLELATGQSNYLEICDIEIIRPGFSYTIDTLHFLKNELPEPEIYFIIGSDNLTEIPFWHKYKEIISQAVLCVTHRPGTTMEIPRELSDAAIETFPSPELDISSSQIRKNISEGRTYNHLVPPPVKTYIDQHGLYR
ncbi:MAG: nicotinate (nicotinamide) nucleotide adenylyltransferase [Chitinivibrionales bacterium]|nr:nicotinate (nicotinamide) nucleotide adenylyltransferase [Chitinivibrionales bacterium]